MLGDLNDFDAQILDVNDNRPTSRVLQILKGAFSGWRQLTVNACGVVKPRRSYPPTHAHIHPRSIDPTNKHTHTPHKQGTDLVSAAAWVPKAERYTDWWDRNGDCQVHTSE